MLEKIKEIAQFDIVNYGSIKISVTTVISIIVIFILFKLFLRLIKRIFRRYLIRIKQDIGRLDALYQIIKYFTWFFYLVICMDMIGLELTWLVTSSAALLVGVGLGLQNVFNDFISGFIILIEGTVNKGDILTVGDTIGVVKSINVRTLEVMTRNNKAIIIPNHRLIEDDIINWSHLNMNPRFNVKVGVAYGSDTKKVKELLLAVAEKHERVDKSPKPFVRFNDFGDSSLNFELFFWCKEIIAIDDILSDLRFNIDEEFRKNGITIPFPQRDVHLFNH